MIRIISGTAKGRRLQAPKNLPVRPTTDRAKEGLFNILQHQYDLTSCQVLDLFSGTGNMSYEFASRQVAQITAVEQHPKCVAFIKKTAVALSFPIKVVQQNALHFLEQCPQTYALIFADPPYQWSIEAYHNLIKRALLAVEEQGYFILEHEKRVEFKEHPNWEVSRTYGSCCFSFFTK